MSRMLLVAQSNCVYKYVSLRSSVLFCFEPALVKAMGIGCHSRSRPRRLHLHLLLNPPMQA